MLLTEMAAPYLEKTKGNVIVISSNLAVRTVSLWDCTNKAYPALYFQHPTNMVYSMTNAARDHFVHNAANLYTPRGIRVNGIK